MKSVFCLLAVAAGLCAQTTGLDFLNHNRPVLDAHNCYPYDGQFADRIDRALKAGLPVSIEQDIAWAADPVSGKGRPVVTHTPQTTGREPTLRDHFFERVRPIVEKALADNDRARWPLILLHFDFKSLDSVLLKAVWEELGEYESWIATAAQTSDPGQLAPFDAKPLLVITEAADVQEEVFFRNIPKGARLRVPPEQILTEHATNYRRWWNNSWAAVEEGGQRNAGDWTPADATRLKSLVDHAHRMGYWIRFYTLDGFTADTNKGWSEGYNFGSYDAATIRWKAALDAGVNFIATDQYEDLAAVMKQGHSK